LKQALDLAQKVKNPRLIANAEFSIADLSDNTGDYDNEIAYAQRAQQHYQAYGSVDGVADATMLIVQGEVGKGDLEQALKDAQAQLESSERTHSDLFVEDSEAEIGHIYTAMEDEPAALTHYLRALEISRKTGSQVALKSLHVAGCLARIGRLREAASIFSAIPASAKTDPDSAREYTRVQVAIEFGEGHYGAAIGLARKAQAMAPEAVVDLAEIVAAAEMWSGQNVQAKRDADDLLTTVQKGRNPDRTAQAELTEALVTVSGHSPANAREMAEAATVYFTRKNMKESEWIALVCDARALKALGDAVGSTFKVRESRDVLGQLQKQWPAEDFKAYLARADVRLSIQSLDAIAGLQSKVLASSAH
jgi:tetratricopeptide (TPR) repeat protein